MEPKYSFLVLNIYFCIVNLSFHCESRYSSRQRIFQSGELDIISSKKGIPKTDNSREYFEARSGFQIKRAIYGYKLPRRFDNVERRSGSCRSDDECESHRFCSIHGFCHHRNGRGGPNRLYFERDSEARNEVPRDYSIDFITGSN
ncbi:unnamed protein product [Orchesella dallaii]|uniref:Secreted protein n=1 Tax=Orchesella dallaii TaxID=48710 RepID=A0ABP1S930_9HEXA